MTTIAGPGASSAQGVIGFVLLAIDPPINTTSPPPMQPMPMTDVPLVTQINPPAPPLTVAGAFSRMRGGQDIPADFSFMAGLTNTAVQTTAPYVSLFAPTSSPRPPQGRTTFNDDGSVQSWHSGTTNTGSYYSLAMLDFYGEVSKSGVAHMSFSNHFRAFADLIGLDGKVGIQGTYSKGGTYTGLAPTISSRPAHRPSENSDSGSSSSGSQYSGDPDPNQHTNEHRPIILDLDGNGIQITDLTQSTTYVDGGDGLEHRTAWAGAGDGVLFYDPDGTGEITEMRQYVFTEWDPTATSDMEALASVFDTNGDGELSGAELDDFRIMVTNADGTTTSHTLAELGITSINLTADATNIVLSDGSVITGQSTLAGHMKVVIQGAQKRMPDDCNWKSIVHKHETPETMIKRQA